MMKHKHGRLIKDTIGRRQYWLWEEQYSTAETIKDKQRTDREGRATWASSSRRIKLRASL